MLQKLLREDWETHVRVATISPTMIFAPEGLVLGASTVLLPMDGPRRLQNIQGHETRVLALLYAFNGGPALPSVLRNIERAAKAWSEGDVCLAYIHLAHARLRQPQDLRSGAYRLEMAEFAMRLGASPRAVFKVLSLDERYIDALEKAYSPAEPRVSAGSGKTSGEWTSGGNQTGGDVAGAGAASVASQGSSLGGTVALPASSFLGELDTGQAAELSAYAFRLLGPGLIGAAVTTFGLLFIPSSNNLGVKGDVADVPGLSYFWNRDEALLHLSYVDASGKATNFSAQLEDDVFRDQNGNVIARILPGGNIVVDEDAVFPESVNDNEPKLCPMPGLDKPGERGRDYADYIKSIVNPVDTTPRYWGFQLINPTNGNLVYYDDCQHETGMMVDAKGPVYAKLLTHDWSKGSIIDGWLTQSMSQIAAAGSRAVRWYFAEPAAAEFARELFRTTDKGRERIEIVDAPWP